MITENEKTACGRFLQAGFLFMTIHDTGILSLYSGVEDSRSADSIVLSMEMARLFDKRDIMGSSPCEMKLPGNPHTNARKCEVCEWGSYMGYSLEHPSAR